MSKKQIVAVSAMMALSLFSSWIQASASAPHPYNSAIQEPDIQQEPIVSSTNIARIQKHCQFVQNIATLLTTHDTQTLDRTLLTLDDIENTYATESAINQKIEVCQELQEQLSL